MIPLKVAKVSIFDKMKYMNNHALVSIIIVSWRVRDLLDKCLESIVKETKNIGYEVIVVDNASDDGTLEMIKNKYKFVRLIANAGNLGFAKANNQGIDKASGEYLLLLNPDTVIKDSAIEKVASFMSKKPEAGICGCRLIFPDGQHQDSVRRFPSFSSTAMIMLKLHYIFKFAKTVKKYLASDFNYKKTQMVDQVMGAFFMIRRQVVEQVGKLDEKYFVWFEEVDYCLRAIKNNWQVYYYADAEVVHYQGQSFGQVMKLAKQKNFNKSALLFFKNHKPNYQYLMLLALSPLSLLISLIIQIFISKR